MLDEVDGYMPMLMLTIKYLIELQSVLLPRFEGFPLDAHVVLLDPWRAREKCTREALYLQTAGGLD